MEKCRNLLRKRACLFMTFLIFVMTFAGLFFQQRAKAGSGSISETILNQSDIVIKDEKALRAVLKAVEKGCDFNGVTIVLQNDIYMTSGYTYTSISTSNANIFSGTLDGNGKTIYNFTVNNKYNTALFIKTSDTARIKNLGVVSPASGNGSLGESGGLVSMNAGSIENCFFKGKASGSNSGGICYNNTGTIKGCYVQDMAQVTGKGTDGVDCVIGTAGLEQLEGITRTARALNAAGSYYYWALNGSSLGFSETEYVKPEDPKPTTAPASQREMQVQVDYSSEELIVTGPEELYFAATTKETSGQKISQKNWRRAYRADDIFRIDFSSLNPKKQNFIALTTDPTVENGKIAVQRVVKLVSTYKSVTFSLNYAQESPNAKGADFLSAVQVVESDKNTRKNLDLHNGFCFQWKKGIMGDWRTMEELDLAQMESCRQTGATLYFRLAATETARASQIATVRVAKQAAAPVLEADISRNSLSLSNGMQFRVGENGSWVTLNYYNKSGSDKKGYKIGSEYVPYNTKSKQECTSVKYRYLEIGQIKEYLKEAGVSGNVLDSGNGFQIQVRRAPSLNKPASTIASYKISPSVPALDDSRIKITSDSKVKNYFIEGLDATRKYEYLIVPSGVLTGTSICVGESKWKKLPMTATGKGKLKAGDTSRYAQKGDSSGRLTSTKISDVGARVILRIAGNKGKGKESFSWASEPSSPIEVMVVTDAEEQKK